MPVIQEDGMHEDIEVKTNVIEGKIVLEDIHPAAI
jgi:hypothetical protein